jgi:hypothetical protein
VEKRRRIGEQKKQFVSEEENHDAEREEKEGRES